LTGFDFDISVTVLLWNRLLLDFGFDVSVTVLGRIPLGMRSSVEQNVPTKFFPAPR